MVLESTNAITNAIVLLVIGLSLFVPTRKSRLLGKVPFDRWFEFAWNFRNVITIIRMFPSL